MYIKLASNSWCVSYSFKYGRPNTIWYSIAQSFGCHRLLFRHFENKRGKNWIKLRYLAKQLANLESRPVYSLINTTSLHERVTLEAKTLKRKVHPNETFFSWYLLAVRGFLRGHTLVIWYWLKKVTKPTKKKGDNIFLNFPFSVEEVYT